MDKTKKRALVLAIFITVLIGGSIAYSIWGTLINHGTLLIYAETPFSVEIFGGENYECGTSPCEVEEKSGAKDIVLKKEGYEPIVTEVDVKLWRNTELNPEFKLIPYLTKAEAIPEADDEIEYKMLYEEGKKMQKLVRADDKGEHTIVYFQKEIEDARIFGSKKYALLLGNEGGELKAYKIDINKNSRKKIVNNNLLDAVGGKWSDDGRYFAYERENLPYLWLMNNEGRSKELALIATITEYAWTKEGNLMFLTGQNTELYEGDYVNISPSIASLGFTLGEYLIAEDKYRKIEKLENILNKPDKIIPTSNMKLLYLSSVGGNYKIILE